MIKKLLKSVREYKAPSILTALFMVGEIMLEVRLPLLLAEIIDNGIIAENMNYVLKRGGLLLLVAACSLALGALSGRFAAHASAGFAKNLRHDIFARIQTFGFRNIDRFSDAGLITRLTTDITNLQNAYQAVIRHLVRAPIMFVAALTMTFSINARMALIYVAVAPILLLGLLLIIRIAHPIFLKVFDKYDNMNDRVQENLRGIRVVKSFVRESLEVEKFRARSGEIAKDFIRAEKWVSMNSPLMQFCIYSAILMISWFGAKNVVAGDLTTGELTGFFTYTMQILMSLMMMSMIVVIVLISAASAKRVCEVLDEEPDFVSPVNGVKDVPDGSIEFRGVSFRYRAEAELNNLEDIDLKIRSGETVGIVGSTGSAKSTLVQLIPRLYDVSEGAVLVGGRDVREYDLDALRSAVSMVLQNNVLFSGTVAENLRWGDENASREEMEEACRLARAHDFVSEMPQGYDSRIDQGGANVSGGQRQRLCIARALLKKPKILILDDSTSAVDTKTDAQIRGALRRCFPQTTKLIIAQRIASVQDADRIILMDSGRVAAFGTHEELLQSSDLYREVYESQNRAASDAVAEPNPVSALGPAPDAGR